MCVGCHAHHGRVNFRLSLLSLDPFGAKACLRTLLPTGLLYEPSGARTTFFGTGGERTPAGKKFRKFFLGGGRILARFLGGRNRIWRAPGGFRGVVRSIWGAKRPGFTRLWPRFGPKMGDNRPGFASQNPRFSDYVIERGGWDWGFFAKFGMGFACRGWFQRRGLP